MSQKTPAKYSKIIVALVILLNACFAGAALYVFLKVEKEPTVLTTAWFAFTTGELWLLANIKKQDQKSEQETEEKKDD